VKPNQQDDGRRALALLEGRGADRVNNGTASAEDARYVVQVGAFGDSDKVREVRTKLERSGLKTYTHAIDTKDGKRIRVRVGPFSSRAEADRAAARVKALDLPASVLSL
jgi:DedD protein